MFYFQRLLIGLQTVMSLVLVYLSTVQSSCQFPEFLLLPSTNIWWSGPVSYLDSTSSFSPFAQITVRGDLRKMILSYPLDFSKNSSHYSFNRYPFQNHPHGISNYTVPDIHVDLRCDQLIDKATETYLAEIQLINTRSLYICMQFHNLDRSSAPEVFELIQGESMTTSSDCSTSNYLHRSIWIPNMSKYKSTNQQSMCPLVGGFQAKNFIDQNTETSICSSSVYVTIDSECIRGEGIEFHFNEPSCNPFEPTLMTKFSCFVQWTEAGNLFAILVKEKNRDEYIVASMFYNEPPTQVDRGNNAYGSFSRVYIGLGIFRPTPESTRDTAGRLYPPFLYELESLDTNLKTSPLIIYKVMIRGAFGVCDDEMEQCERGCNADARNRLFCRRSCSSVRKECIQLNQICGVREETSTNLSPKNTVQIQFSLIPVNPPKSTYTLQANDAGMTYSDSCEINASYRGLWMLIDPLPSPTSQHAEPRHPQHHLRKLINIADRTVTFADVLGDETFYEFSCLREASEIVPDWYILGGMQLQPGCHPRDVCLEASQNRPIFSNEAPNTNTLLFRLSKSQRQGADITSLCTFPDGSKSLKQRRPQMLVKQARHQDVFLMPNGRIFNASKCELYQIKLRGSIRLRAQFFSNLIAAQAARQFNPFLGNGESEFMEFGWNRKDPTSLPEMVSCSIELSDFNPKLGTTGEFDGYLRLKSSCSVDLFSKFTNTAHQCISVHNLDKSFKYTKRLLMLVTYSDFLKSFFCWIIQESEIDGKPTFKIYLFLTPQCQYEETPLGDIVINNSSAVAIMHVATEKDPYINREQNTQPEQTRSPVFQKFRHFENGISIIQRTAVTTSSTTNIRVSLITLTAPSFVHLLFFHLWSLLTL